LKGRRFRIETNSGEGTDTIGIDGFTTGTPAETTTAEQIDWLPQKMEQLKFCAITVFTTRTAGSTSTDPFEDAPLPSMLPPK